MNVVARVLRHYVTVILLAASVAFAVRIFVVEAYRVPWDFMAPCLDTGDLIFVNKLSYGLFAAKPPRRGDVVVFSLFSDPGKEYLKRVIGLPGDRVEIRESVVYLNGKPISKAQEEGLGHLAAFEEEVDGLRYEVLWDHVGSLPEVVVPENNLFVLGDNRSKGQDSRHWGFLPMTGVKGRAWFIWWSKGKGKLFTRI